MALRISWDRYEVALLFDTYKRITKGSDINEEAAKLSQALRGLAIRKGISIDETYRNVNGMKMQLANVQYLFTDGRKGLSGASAGIRQMYVLYKTNQKKYQAILKEAMQMAGSSAVDVEESFYTYAKSKTNLPPQMLAYYLKLAADYCHLKQPILGMVDVKAVNKVQQKVATGKLLRFRFGKNAQTIRNAMQLYYAFIKTYREPKEEDIAPPVPMTETSVVEQAPSETSGEINAEEMLAASTEAFASSNELGTKVVLQDSVFKPECSFEDNPGPYASHPSTESVPHACEDNARLSTDEWIIAQLKARGIAYQDKRGWGGCLWMVGGHELDTFVQDCKAKGYTFLYKADGCKSYPDQLVWRTKDIVEQKNTAPTLGHKTGTESRMTIKDAAVKMLREAGESLTISEITRRIEAQQLYRFNSNNPPLMVYKEIKRYCRGMKDPHHSPLNEFDRFAGEAGLFRYKLIGEGMDTSGSSEAHDASPLADNRWQCILQESFPDGYILNDSISQLQASGFWQERYHEACPIEGEAIDAVMKAIGAVRDGRVFVKSKEARQLIAAICAEIDDILCRYTVVYRSCIFERYQEQLAVCQIYTEQVMAQQLLGEAKDRFYSVHHMFVRRGQLASVVQDVRKVLRDHGGAMSVRDVEKELWFIPHDIVYRSLSADDGSLNIGDSTWMLAEHFPLNREGAEQIGDMLDEYFLTNDYLQAVDLPSLLQKRLPSIADDLSGMNYMAVFHIVAYYLENRFSFTKAIVAPKGSDIDFTDLFRRFSAGRDTFTLADLEALASELKLPIYWESTYAGGAVRISKTEFVNKRFVRFNVDATDEMLKAFCPGDYLPLMAVSSAMMMHLPSCGYPWNEYLLQSYVYCFSKVFMLCYSSFGKMGAYGSMVRRDCKAIDDYASLIERVLTDDDTWETTADALNLLVRRGYQALRRYKGIDDVVAKARQNKRLMDGR